LAERPAETINSTLIAAILIMKAALTYHIAFKSNWINLAAPVRLPAGSLTRLHLAVIKGSARCLSACEPGFATAISRAAGDIGSVRAHPGSAPHQGPEFRFSGGWIAEADHLGRGSSTNVTSSCSTTLRCSAPREGIIARLKKLEAGGVENVLFAASGASIAGLRTFAEEIMPAFADAPLALAQV
jgi:hypothetical protein